MPNPPHKCQAADTDALHAVDYGAAVAVERAAKGTLVGGRLKPVLRQTGRRWVPEAKLIGVTDPGLAPAPLAGPPRP